MSAKKPSTPGKSSASRREALRIKREAEAKRQRRNRLLGAIVGVVVLAVIVTVVVVVVNRGSGPGTPTLDTPTATGTSTALTGQIDPPDGDSQRAWITVPSSNTKPDALIVDIHTDYQCPYCRMAEDAYATIFEQLSDRGDIILRQHTRTFLDGIGNQTVAMSTKAAVAAACVDVAAPDKYAAYHNTLFAQQPQTEGNGWTDSQLTQDFPASIGLTGDALATFQSCYANQSTLQWVRDVESNNLHVVANKDGFPPYLFGGTTTQTDTDGKITGTKGAQYGVAGTPTFFVQGKQFSLTDLFDNSWNPTIALNPDALLAFLQQVAQS
ncbi:MAG: DsbA family protein [Propionibacteriaceae bacterium]|nr:DsbA family protein [Propionibacteriaceae bacterium]